MTKTKGAKGITPKFISDNKTEVFRLAKIGLTTTQIATVLKVSNDTLEKHFSEPMDEGKAHALATVATFLWEKIQRKHSASIFFYLKTRGGWRETNKVEVSGEDGKELNINVTVSEKK